MTRVLSLGVLLLIAVISGRANAADGKTVQKIAPVPQGQFSNEQQESALKTLSAARKEVLTFVTAFPSTSFRVWRPGAKSSRIRIDLTAHVRGDYMIMLAFEGQFDAGLTKVDDIKCEMFNVIVLADIQDIKPGEVRNSIEVKLEELDALCADLDAFVAAKRKVAKKR